MRELYKPVARTCFMVVPLLAGIWVYSKGRTSQTLYEAWLKVDKRFTGIPLSDWLPDYLWCFSLLAGMVLLWRGWNKIPLIWKLSIWILVCSTEWLQYLHLIPGTGDLMDLLFYQAAFVSVILLHKINAI